eukprot:COSAG02_NODE_9066_length_2343_cov_304.658200_3_plen_74_part_00
MGFWGARIGVFVVVALGFLSVGIGVFVIAALVFLGVTDHVMAGAHGFGSDRCSDFDAHAIGRFVTVGARCCIN